MFSTSFVFELFLSGRKPPNPSYHDSTKLPKDNFFVNVVNPYLAEVKMHPQTLQLKDDVLHKQDLEEPKKKGDEIKMLDEVKHEVFKCKKMVERGVEANHSMISDLTNDCTRK